MLLTLRVVAGVDAVPGQRDVVMRVLQRLQEGHQVLVIGQLFSHREGHHHHVDGCVSVGQRSEERGDRPLQLLHCALGRRRRVAQVLRVTHALKQQESHKCSLTLLISSDEIRPNVLNLFMQMSLTSDINTRVCFSSVSVFCCVSLLFIVCIQCISDVSQRGG